MKLLPLDASDDLILEAVREWVELLIQERYADACAFTYSADGPEYSASQLKALIECYGSYDSSPNGHRFRVTTPEHAAPHPPGLAGVPPVGPTREVSRDLSEYSRRKEPRLIASVWYDLPLDGRWSDLTARLEVLQVGPGLVLRIYGVNVP